MTLSTIALLGLCTIIFCNIWLTVFLLNQNSHKLDQITELAKMIGRLADNQKMQSSALLKIMKDENHHEH